MVHVAAATHVGMVRSRNEDAVALPGVLLADSPPAVVHMRVRPIDGMVFAVVDGMGGHAGGRTASHLVAEGLLGPSTDITATLHGLNRDLYDEMIRRPELTAMGATVAGIRVSGRSVSVFNVGDARVYRHVGRYSSIVSVDDRGTSATELTQSMGGTARPVAIDVHVTTFDLEGPERFLLCSDGLSEVVPFSLIQRTLGDLPADATVVRRVELALQAGAPDNVSVVVIDMSISPGGGTRQTEDG